jgi:hypothetical protein
MFLLIFLAFLDASCEINCHQQGKSEDRSPAAAAARLILKPQNDSCNQEKTMNYSRRRQSWRLGRNDSMDYLTSVLSYACSTPYAPSPEDGRF